MHNEKWLFEVALGMLYSTSKEGESAVESEQESEHTYQVWFLQDLQPEGLCK